MARVSEAGAVCLVPPGTYWIGTDSIPNAAPRHVRRFTNGVWLDRELVAWSDYEAFVIAGGYTDAAWWHMDDGQPFPETARPASIDARCEVVRAMSFVATNGRPAQSRTRDPVLGLNWFEAAAVCRFFGARLPFETEWEVAMTQKFLAGGTGPRIPTHQEWCLDAYTRQYWRADADVRGRPWSLKAEVVVRGHAATEPAIGLTSRRAADPFATAVQRGFRRVWESPRDV